MSGVEDDLGPSYGWLYTIFQNASLHSFCSFYKSISPNEGLITPATRLVELSLFSAYGIGDLVIPFFLCLLQFNMFLNVCNTSFLKKQCPGLSRASKINIGKCL